MVLSRGGRRVSKPFSNWSFFLLKTTLLQLLPPRMAAVSNPKTAAAGKIVPGTNVTLPSSTDTTNNPSDSSQGSLWPVAHARNARRIACWGSRPQKKLAATTPGSCRWDHLWRPQWNARCYSHRGQIREGCDLGRGPEFGAPCPMVFQLVYKGKHMSGVPQV